MDWISKNRKTGEIVTILRKITGCNESTVEYIGRDLIQRTKTVEEFNDEFEDVVYDFSGVLPYVSAAAEVFPQVREVLFPFARKLDHTYYNRGDTVFIENSDPSLNRYMRQSQALAEIAENQAFIIVDIKKDVLEVELYWLILYPVYISPDGIKKIKDELERETPDQPYKISENTVSLPYYKERILAKDAAWFLKRFDKEY